MHPRHFLKSFICGSLSWTSIELMLLVDIWLLLAVNPPSIFFMIDGRSQMGAEAKHGLGDSRSQGRSTVHHHHHHVHHHHHHHYLSVQIVKL